MRLAPCRAPSVSERRQLETTDRTSARLAPGDFPPLPERAAPSGASTRGAELEVRRLGSGEFARLLQSLAVSFQHADAAGNDAFVIAMLARRLQELHPRQSDPARAATAWKKAIASDDAIRPLLGILPLNLVRMSLVAAGADPELVRRVVYGVERWRATVKGDVMLVDRAVERGADRARLTSDLRRAALEAELVGLAGAPRPQIGEAGKKLLARGHGRGRRRGARGAAPLARQDDLGRRTLERSLEEQLDLLLVPGVARHWVFDHAHRHGVGQQTGYRDWHHVRSLVSRQAGYATRLAHAVIEGDPVAISRENRRVARFERRVLGARRRRD